MKIISKLSDYYDHQVSYFGFDPTRVYDRRNKDAKSIENLRAYGLKGHFDRFSFAICGRIKNVFRDKKGHLFFTPNDDMDWNTKLHFVDNDFRTDINLKYRQPVLQISENDKKVVYGIPNLASFGFAVHIPARKMYGDIYDFLGYLNDNPPIPDNQSNKEKVASHGFDTKRSFRPKMKK